MAVSLSPVFGAAAQRFLNNSVTPNVAGLIYTYQAGTTTPAATYTDNTGATPNANPIVLDGNGRVPNEVWFTTGQSYKILETTSDGSIIGTWDNIAANVSATDLSSLQAQITALASSFTTASLTVSGGTTLNTLSVGAVTGSGAANFGSNAITAGAASLGAITSSGNLALGSNTITSGAITSSGGLTATTLTLTGGGGITVPGPYTNSAAGAVSATANGYLKLNNGIILQWGKISGISVGASIGTGTNGGPTSYPVAFPTAVLSVQLTPITPAYCAALVNGAPGVSSFSWSVVNLNNLSNTCDLQWLAVGY